MTQLLALFDNEKSFSYTNFSRLYSLSIFDTNGTEILIKNALIEFFISWDPNLSIPSMVLQNVTSINHENRFFHFHLINLTDLNDNLTYSIHLEMLPLEKNLSFLLIYQFNQMSLMTNSIKNVHGWELFCSSSKRKFLLLLVKLIIVDFL